MRLVCGWCGRVLAGAGADSQVSPAICGGRAQPQMKEDAPIEHRAWLGAFDEDIALAATTDIPLLITGGSPDDRLRVARRVHGRSRWRPLRLLFSSCDASPSADLARLLALASTPPASTLFLDGVDGLESPAQAVLCESLERRLADRPGAGAPGPLPAGPRVIAGTGEDLLATVEGSTFDPRLFYRLNALHIDLRTRRA